MINLYAALLGGPAQPEGTGEGDGQLASHAMAGGRGGDQPQLDADAVKFADVFDERLAEAFGEHLPTAALEALADAETLLTDASIVPELLGEHPPGERSTDAQAATEADTAADAASTVAQSTVWRLQAALHAAAHGLAVLTDGDAAQEVLEELGEEATAVAALTGLVGAGDGAGDEVGVVDGGPAAGDAAGPEDASETAETAENVEDAELLAAASAVVAARGAEADTDADVEAEGRMPLRGDRGGTREGSGRTEAPATHAREPGTVGVRAGERTAATGPVDEVDADLTLEGDDTAAELPTPGREGRAGAGVSGESLTRVVRGERLGVEAPLTTSPTEATATTTPRSEVAETGAMRPSAAAATIERVLEAAARLDKMPPPRQLTLEVGDARVRLGLEDGVLRVQLVGETQPEDRELLRDVTAELRSRGFDLGPGDGRGDGDGPHPEDGQPATSPGGHAPVGAGRPAAAMPANATTDLRL